MTQDREGEPEIGMVGVLDGDNGKPKWERVWGAGARTVHEVSFQNGNGDRDRVLVVAMSLEGTVDFGGDVGSLTSNGGAIEALVLGLDFANDGEALWATKSSASNGESADARLVEVVDGYAYVACSGAGCQQFGSMKKASADHDGAVVKLNAKTGEVVWVADAPGALGMAVNSDGEVYLQVMGNAETFGDVSYANMGQSDQYIVKLQADGHGAWALQQGGGPCGNQMSGAPRHRRDVR